MNRIARLPPNTKPREPDISPQQAEQDRQTGYRTMGLCVATYHYPNYATIGVEVNGRRINLKFPLISGQHYRRVKDRITALQDEYPEASIYITIPSKHIN